MISVYDVALRGPDAMAGGGWFAAEKDGRRIARRVCRSLMQPAPERSTEETRHRGGDRRPTPAPRTLEQRWSCARPQRLRQRHQHLPGARVIAGDPSWSSVREIDRIIAWVRQPITDRPRVGTSWKCAADIWHHSIPAAVVKVGRQLEEINATAVPLSDALQRAEFGFAANR